MEYTPYRAGPGRLPGAPLRTPTFAEALALLASGDLEAGRHLRRTLTPNLARLLGALRRSSTGNKAPTSTALTIAIHRVEEDPAGRASGCRDGWTPVEFAAFAVWRGLEQVARAPAATDDRIARLSPAQRLTLVLVTMEGLPFDAVADLLGVPPDDVERTHRRTLAALGLADEVDVACPGWPLVARMGSSEGEEHGDALVHVARCDRCRVGRDRVEHRRAGLAERDPSLAGTGLGRAVLFMHRYR